MSGASIIIIVAGTGPRLNTDFDIPYSVAAGDTAENTATGAVELHFTGSVSGPAVIPVPGLSGYEFTESGTFMIYQ